MSNRRAFQQFVNAYCRADRQWPRHLRIAHAHMMLRTAGSDEQFWRAVLKRNGARPSD